VIGWYISISQASFGLVSGDNDSNKSWPNRTDWTTQASCSRHHKTFSTTYKFAWLRQHSSCLLTPLTHTVSDSHTVHTLHNHQSPPHHAAGPSALSSVIPQ
jgi:hypothetical protein